MPEGNEIRELYEEGKVGGEFYEYYINKMKEVINGKDVRIFADPKLYNVEEIMKWILCYMHAKERGTTQAFLKASKEAFIAMQQSNTFKYYREKWEESIQQNGTENRMGSGENSPERVEGENSQLEERENV